MNATQRIALVAHDQRTADLPAWAPFYTTILATHELYAAGTTGQLLGDHCELAILRITH